MMEGPETDFRITNTHLPIVTHATLFDYPNMNFHAPCMIIQLKFSGTNPQECGPPRESPAFKEFHN
jgi:hypothetical protein